MSTYQLRDGRTIDTTDTEAIQQLSDDDFAEMLALTLDSDSPRTTHPLTRHVDRTGEAFAIIPAPTTDPTR